MTTILGEQVQWVNDYMQDEWLELVKENCMLQTYILLTGVRHDDRDVIDSKVKLLLLARKVCMVGVLL